MRSPDLSGRHGNLFRIVWSFSVGTGITRPQQAGDHWSPLAYCHAEFMVVERSIRGRIEISKIPHSRQVGAFPGGSRFLSPLVGMAYRLIEMTDEGRYSLLLSKSQWTGIPPHPPYSLSRLAEIWTTISCISIPSWSSTSRQPVYLEPVRRYTCRF